MRDDQHLVLIGLMGSGKTTAGRVLAERLGRRFVDTDAVIEAEQGRTIPEIFATAGEDGFRDIEAATLGRILDDVVPSVIAGGGGVVLRPENRDALRAGRCRVIWLCTEPVHLYDRVKTSTNRPLLQGDDPLGTLARLAEVRRPLYREVAHAIVSTDGRTVHDVVEAILR